MAKVVIRRTAQEKAEAKRRFRALLAERVERAMYLEGQAVPEDMKTARTQELRAANRVTSTAIGDDT